VYRALGTITLAVLAACNTADLVKTPPADNGSADPTCPDGDPTCTAAGPGGSVDAGVRGTAGAPTSTGAVTIQVEPGDDGKMIVDAIRGASQSVHMTMYLLTTEGLGWNIIQALGDQKDAGKDVKVVLNKTFPANGGDNTASFQALTKRGVPVHWASSAFTYTHAKAIVLDGSKSLIMTMNMTETSAGTNREYLALDQDPDDATTLETLFAADFDGTPVQVKSKLVVSPTAANQTPPRDQLKALIDSAKSSVDVEVQSLSDRTLVDALIAAHSANVAVRVLVDGPTSTSPSELAAIAKLKQAGVPLRSIQGLDLHAKCIVVDEAQTFVGSQNFTATALTDNREIGVITDAKSEATKVRGIIGGDFDHGTDL
jgi:phosphatidylserine/phosphatidylglycerophosphate/cardiolipin synthase-like enzyme